MNEKNLMIGDIVLASVQDGEHTFPVRITAIDENGMLGINGDKHILFEPFHKEDYEEAELLPYPLSETILETLGFQRCMTVSDEAPYDIDEEGYAYYSYGNDFWGWYKGGTLEIAIGGLEAFFIKSVHHLQHMLREAGHDINITL